MSIVVVGTNGKGTVTSMIAAGLTAAGHVTGRFTSPHVESFRERISVDGEQISDGAVARFVATVRGSRLTEGALKPAFFEWSLALALNEFTRRGATAAVLEAGVGGAGDATRAVQPVSLVVLTNVDLDHTDTLGESLEEIATDKAGAARRGVPLISGARQPSVRAAVKTVAANMNAPLHELPLTQPAEGSPFALPSELEAQLRTRSGTRLANARVAAAALRLLGAPEGALEAGLRTPPLPARGERYLLRTSGAEPVEVLLDGAHDAAAATRLVASLQGRPYVLLFGSLARRAPAAVLEVLAGGASAVVLTAAQEEDGVVGAWPSASAITEPQAALEAAVTAASTSVGRGERPLVVVVGSLYLAGRIRPLLRATGERVVESWELPVAGR